MLQSFLSILHTGFKCSPKFMAYTCSLDYDPFEYQKFLNIIKGVCTWAHS